MSNVLIGIIGVILFIGLALAGALYLGPQFQNATSSSRASSTISTLSQLSSAINAKIIQNDEDVLAGSSMDSLIASGHIKADPTNPTGGDPAAIYGPNGETASVEAGMVAMRLNENAEAVCSAIAKQTSKDLITANNAAQLPAIKAGCFHTGPTSINSFAGDSYYAFSRI